MVTTLNILLCAHWQLRKLYSFIGELSVQGICTFLNNVRVSLLLQKYKNSLFYSFSYRISPWYPGWSWTQDLHAQHLEGPIFWGEFCCLSGVHEVQEDWTFTLRAVRHEARLLFCTCPLAFLLSVPNRNSMRPSWRESWHQGRALRIPSLQTISQYEFRKSGYLHGWQSSGYWPTRLDQSFSPLLELSFVSRQSHWWEGIWWGEDLVTNILCPLRIPSGFAITLWQAFF